jgi:hypothetical protein
MLSNKIRTGIKLPIIIPYLILVCLFVNIVPKTFASEYVTSPELSEQVSKIRKKYNVKIENPYCIGDKEDPFEIGATIKSGPLKGQCFDTELNRPVMVIENNITKLKLANVRFANQWWIGEISNNSVKDVYFQIIEFESPVSFIKVAHTQLRFTFKDSYEMKLNSQVASQNEVAFLKDITISFNIFGIHDLGFSVSAALDNSFGIVQKIISPYDRSVEEMIYDKSLVRQFKLNLLDIEKNKLLIFSIFNSQVLGYNKNYDLLNRNCTTELFNLIDEVIPPPKGVLAYSRDFSPTFIQKYMSAIQGPVNSIFTYGNIQDLIIGPSLEALKKRNILGEEIEPLNISMQNGELAMEVIEHYKKTVRHPSHPLIPILTTDTNQINE